MPVSDNNFFHLHTYEYVFSKIFYLIKN